MDYLQYVGKQKGIAPKIVIFLFYNLYYVK